MTTDIDELIAEARCAQVSVCGYRAHMHLNQLADALTAERAKVAALGAEVERLETENHYAYGGRPCDAKGGCLDRSTCGDCSEPGAIDLAQVEAARWREVAGELAGELTRAFSINWKDAPDEAMDISQCVRCALHNYRHTLATYQQVRGE